jgi:5-(carboxyamino)imidazole ribonucleotide mutase
MNQEPKIVIALGSDSDLPYFKQAIELLTSFKVSYETRILSAHRTPEEVREFARKAKKRGVEIIIALAGGSAHLAGVIASYSSLPVIGVPIPTKIFKGIDSYISMLQMPRGVPVAVMSIGETGAVNAVIFALKILALRYKKFFNILKKYRENLRKKTVLKNGKVKSLFPSY